MLDINEVQQTLQQIFEQAAEDIRQRHQAAGQVASGRTRDSIRVEVVPSVFGATATMYGREYFGSLETGSKPWSKQYAHPPRAFVNTIQEWMDDKGLTGISAYLVARKIMMEGSSLYRKGGREDIFTPAMEQVEQRVGEEISKIFDSIITQTLKRL